MMLNSDKKNPFYRYVLPYMGSNMYVWIENTSALLIDPQRNDEVVSILNSEGVTNVLIILTHEHFDHTSGVNFFRQKFSDVCVIAHRLVASCISHARNNRPLALLKLIDEVNREAVLREYNSYMVEPIIVDKVLDSDRSMKWNNHTIAMVHVPGHSPGSMLVLFDDQYVCSGDYMIPDTEVILRYPGGSEKDYKEKTLPRLMALPDDVMILPGHGEPYRLKK